MKRRVIAFLNAYSQGKSGGDMVFIEIAKRLTKYKKCIITSALGKRLCEKNNINGEFIVTSTEKSFKRPIYLYIKRTISALFIKMRLNNHDILLGTSDFLPDVLPIFILKFKNKHIPWLQHIFHLISPERKIPYYAQKISLILIKLLADVIVVDNTLLKEEFTKKGFAKNKIFVNYPGINSLHLRKFQKHDEVGYDGVCIAQIRPAKGISELIEIWNIVCNKYPSATLGIIGTGSPSIMAHVRSLIQKNKLNNNVYLLGFLSDKKAFQIIKNSKIFVFPSFEEGFGIAALEAQSLGLPVVAWDLPVFREVFPKGMKKVMIGNKEQFSQEIIRLVQNPLFYRKLSQDATLNATRFDWGKSAKKECHIIEKITVRKYT